jgi:aryl-alcohol dehydrogenase-like predicted oxidoreductase
MRGNSRRHIIQQCEASLKRLQTDWIDLYQIHRPQPGIPIDETLRALDDLIRAGKVRYIGTSTFAAWQVVESLWASKELGLNRFVTEQPPYNLLDRRIERELIPMAETYGIGLLPWSPLAGGFLTGKYRQKAPVPEGSRLSPGRGGHDGMWTAEAWELLEVLEKQAQKKGCTASQLALAWCVHQPGVTSPIIGPRTMEQLDDNLGAVKIELTDEDRGELDHASHPGKVIANYYGAEFGPHPYRI